MSGQGRRVGCRRVDLHLLDVPLRRPVSWRKGNQPALCISVMLWSHETTCSGCAPYRSWEASTSVTSDGVISGRDAPVGDSGAMVMAL